MISNLVYTIGLIPLVGPLLRKAASSYPEGSVTVIRAGLGKGMKWKRYHRFVNGYWLGIYESELQETIARELSAGSVFYDVGANAGFFSLIAARLVGPGGAVYSFEPLPENAQVLEEHIELNALDNLKLVRMAVSANPGEATFVRAGVTDSRLAEVSAGGHTDALTVRVTTLDQFAAIHRPPDFAKIDVEGAEAQVLEGGRELLKSHRPRLLIELHSCAAHRGCRQILESCGYAIGTMGGDIREQDGVFPHYLLARPS